MLITHSLQARCCSELRSVFVIEFNGSTLWVNVSSVIWIIHGYWHLLSKLYRRVNHKVKAISTLDFHKLLHNVTYSPTKIQPVWKIVRTFRVSRDHGSLSRICLPIPVGPVSHQGAYSRCCGQAPSSIFVREVYVWLASLYQFA